MLENTSAKLIFPKIENRDCPIFVPIYLEEDIQKEIKEFLIDNDIYCPSHWPKPQEKCKSNLYNREISLICDQRYNEEQIKEYINILKKKLGEKNDI